MMTYEQLLDSMTHEIYSNMRKAIELGRWPNGIQLTQSQREISLRAIIAYEHRQNIPNEQRVGYLQAGQCASATEVSPLIIKH